MTMVFRQNSSKFDGMPFHREALHNQGLKTWAWNLAEYHII